MMKPIVQQGQVFPDFPESSYLYFLDSLIDIFNPLIDDKTLWTFSVRHGVECQYEYIKQRPIHCPKEALIAAKLHALTNFCERSSQTHCITDYVSDRVLVQSESRIGLFGNAENMAAKDFYPSPQDRIEVLRDLCLNGRKTEYKNYLVDLDGRKLKGVSSIELIELDVNSRFLIEVFNPHDIGG